MRIQKIICDKCKKEIKKNPLKVYFEEIDRDNGDFTTGKTELENTSDLTEMDFCEVCMDELQRMVRTFVNSMPAQIVLDTKQIAKSAKLENVSVKKTQNTNKKYDHDAIWDLHKQGKRNIEIEKELGVPKATVAWVICTRRKKEAEQVSTPVKKEEAKTESKESEYGKGGLEGKLKELEQEVLSAPKTKKKDWYDPETMIVEKSDDGRRNIVSRRKPTPVDGQPVKVCLKNCMVCQFSSTGGYCDYSTITGESRNDKPGLCTHRKLR